LNAVIKPRKTGVFDYGSKKGRVGWREERREFDTHLKANPPIE
jgi:hypothetical protein